MSPVYKNQKGFTLIEAIFAVLILAVVTLGFGKILTMAMQTYNFNFGVRSAHHQALNDLEDERSLLCQRCKLVGGWHEKINCNANANGNKKKGDAITIETYVQPRLSNDSHYTFSIDSYVQGCGK
jgi:prepilin-type N-terminal cleavage/methylation domain-containing protein